MSTTTPPPDTTPGETLPPTTPAPTAPPTTITRFPIIALGDSVMLGAAPALRENGAWVDAVVGRQLIKGIEIMQQYVTLGSVGDVVVVHLGNNGPTSEERFDELLNLLPAIKRFSVKIISLTGGLKSSLARHSDIVLNVHVPKEACPFNLAPTSSTTATLVMGDALAMAVLQARGFKQSDFAKYHPSGAIGRAMLLRVGEIMRTGDRNAVAGENLTVKEALLVMTKAKSGSLAVINARGKLTGVFTDGDFRRKMSTDENLLVRTIKSVMTPNPICVRDTALAVEALKIFNERNIDDLIVVNAKKEPVGLIDSQDLPKLKIM